MGFSAFRRAVLDDRHRAFRVCAFFVLVIAALNWQLLLHLRTHIVGGITSDAFEALWMLDWARGALFERGIWPLYEPAVYTPHGWCLASGAQPVWWMIALAPLAQAFGATMAYNLALLATLVVGGVGAALLARRLTGRTLAGLVAGCVYVSAPVMTMRECGHLHVLLSAQWLPYLALFSHESLAGGRRRSWLGAGISLSLSMLGHWQFVFIAPLVPLCIFAFAPGPAAWKRRAGLLGRVAWVGAMLVLPFAALAWRHRSRMFDEPAVFTESASDRFSTSPDRLFVPNPLHPLWGEWSRRVFPSAGEQDTVAIGTVAAVLALLGVCRASSARRPYFAMTLSAIVLAMGTTLHWNGRRVELPLPHAGAESWKVVSSSVLDPDMVPAGDRTTVPLPVSVLDRIVPFFDSQRAWCRYLIVGMLAIGCLAGAGASAILDRHPRAGGIVALLLAAILFEGLTAPYADFTTTASHDRPVDAWLAAQPKPVAIIEYPLPDVNVLALYAQSHHRQRIANGYMSIAPTHWATACGPLGRWPSEATVPLLRQWGVDYVIVNGRGGPEFEREVSSKIRALPGLQYVGSFGHGFANIGIVEVFRVLSE